MTCKKTKKERATLVQCKKSFWGGQSDYGWDRKKSQTGFYFDTNFCGGNIYCEWRDIFRIYMCEKTRSRDSINGRARSDYI